jgi:antirestriction protein ArdC
MVADRIAEQMNKGIVPWHQPWVGGSAVAINYESRKAYSMLNQFLLGEPGEWLTWRQIAARKGKVKKGAHSRFVVFYQMTEKTTVNAEGKEEVETYPVLKWYNVFRLADVEGIESKIAPVVSNPDNDPIETAEAIVNGYLAREKGLHFHNDQPSGEAYYSRSTDTVVVPMLGQFESSEEYYSTTFHELTHSTMPESRCNRVAESNITRFGDNDYSREELVAEIGAAMLCNRAGLDSEKAFNNSVAYLQSWLKVLKNDPKMIVWAAGRAEKAARFIQGETA